MALWNALLVQGVIIGIPSGVLLLVAGVTRADNYEAPEWTKVAIRIGILGVVAGLLLGSLAVWTAVR